MDEQARRDGFELKDQLLYGSILLPKLIVTLLFASGYGYFRDELYYLECATFLDWGYVDHPPFSILVLALTRAVFGDGLYSIRVPPALASTAAIFVCGLVARRMGGGRLAQAVAMLALAIGPVYVVTGSFFSMNPFDHLFWAIAVYLVLLLIQGADPRLWLIFGLVCGIGLQNKLSMLFFGAGLLIALLLTEHRRQLRSPWFCAGGGVAFLIFLPHLVWQVSHGWPTLEFMANARLYKNNESPLEFLLGQVLHMHPFVAAVWIPGLFYAFASTAARPYRLFAITFLLILLFLAATSGRSYYMTPAYTPVVALGGLAVERACAGSRWRAPLFAGLLIGGGLILLPYSLPILAPAQFIQFQSAIGINAPPKGTTHTNVFPQHLGDRFGWPEMTEFIAGHYNALSPGEREQCVLVVGNYGEAAAIAKFGPMHGLPRAVSGHNNYYLWGPGAQPGNICLVYLLHDDDPRLEQELDALRETFASVEPIGVFTHPFAMPEETNRLLLLCRRPMLPLQEAWPRLKHFI